MKRILESLRQGINAGVPVLVNDVRCSGKTTALLILASELDPLFTIVVVGSQDKAHSLQRRWVEVFGPSSTMPRFVGPDERNLPYWTNTPAYYVLVDEWGYGYKGPFTAAVTTLPFIVKSFQGPSPYRTPEEVADREKHTPSAQFQVEYLGGFKRKHTPSVQFQVKYRGDFKG